MVGHLLESAHAALINTGEDESGRETDRRSTVPHIVIAEHVPASSRVVGDTLSVVNYAVQRLNPRLFKNVASDVHLMTLHWDWVIPLVFGPVVVLTAMILAYLAGTALVKPTVRKIFRRQDDTGHLARPLSRAALYLTVVIGVGVGLVAAGYRDVFGVLGTIVAAGTVAIGFAMKDTLSAFVSGIFIFFDKPFVIGDVIEWNDQLGEVKDIRIRTTRVETFDNELLSVPNNEITENTVKNLTANRNRRFDVTFGIGYDDDPAEAKQILRDVVADMDRVLDDPEPEVIIDSLGDSAVNILVRFWLDQTQGHSPPAVEDTLYEQGLAALDEAGVDIPYPTRTIAGDSLRIEDSRGE